MKSVPSLFFVFVATWGAVSIAPAQALPQASPFLPAATAGNSSPGAAKYQLGGMITKDKEVLVSITRMSDKQSFWVPVGGTVNEVTVISYNTTLDQAAIKADGEQFTLTLRAAAVATGGGASSGNFAGEAAPTPPLPPPSGPPEVQEREARMLVTDLLEIGQEHRKAYEEAQRRAAAEKKK